MVNKSEIKKLIDRKIVAELERLEKVITIVDCGPKAKQKDVTKIREAIKARINKIQGIVVEKSEV